MKIGILSSGGDCPGINATIRGVGKTAIMHYGMEVIGIHSGFVGLLNKDVQTFDERSLSGILTWAVRSWGLPARNLSVNSWLQAKARNRSSLGRIMKNSAWIASSVSAATGHRKPQVCSRRWV